MIEDNIIKDVLRSNNNEDFIKSDQVQQTNNSKVGSHNMQTSLCSLNEEKHIEIIPNVYVKAIINEDVIIKVGFPVTEPISVMYELFAGYFNIEKNNLRIVFGEQHEIVSIDMKFSELHLGSRPLIEVAVTIDDIEASMDLANKIKHDSSIPNEKSIFAHYRNLDEEGNKAHTVRVEIERIPFTKHFLGGFTNRNTGIEYHHVATQTRVLPKVLSEFEMVSRDTQTYKIRNRNIDNIVTTATQMTTTGYYVSNVEDKVVVPGRYQTSDELEAFILSKIIIIQKYYRRWLAKQRVAKLREIRDIILDYELSLKNKKAQDKERRLNELYRKRLSPLYDDDFDLVYSALEKWRQNQIAKIDPTLPISVQKAIKMMILDEQHDWLIAIDKLKNKAVKILNFRAKKNKLIKVAKPLTWKNKFGEELKMDFVETTHGRQLFEVYKSLSMDYFNEEERLDILLTLKRLILGRNEKIISELIALIDRECDLIMRNVGMDLLKGLRTRIGNLFLILCRMPSFNPGIEKHLQIPKNPLDLRGKYQFCRICNKYLKNNQFMFSVMSKRLGPCKSCTRLHNHGILRVETSPHRHILNVLRKSEEEYQDYPKMAFIFSERDMMHLICNIWDSKSILSSNEDLENLIFIRWDRTHQWSPWNTAFMTYDEADAHYKLEHSCDSYNNILLNKIHQKQILGKHYFNALDDLGKRFQVHNKKEEMKRIEELKREDEEKFVAERKLRF